MPRRVRATGGSRPSSTASARTSNLGIGTYADAGSGGAPCRLARRLVPGPRPAAHALFGADRTKISPYSPSSRLFLETFVHRAVTAARLCRVAGGEDPRRSGAPASKRCAMPRSSITRACGRCSRPVLPGALDRVGGPPRHRCRVRGISRGRRRGSRGARHVRGVVGAFQGSGSALARGLARSVPPRRNGRGGRGRPRPRRGRVVPRVVAVPRRSAIGRCIGAGARHRDADRTLPRSRRRCRPRRFGDLVASRAFRRSRLDRRAAGPAGAEGSGLGSAGLRSP